MTFAGTHRAKRFAWVPNHLRDNPEKLLHAPAPTFRAKRLLTSDLHPDSEGSLARQIKGGLVVFYENS